MDSVAESGIYARHWTTMGSPQTGWKMDQFIGRRSSRRLHVLANWQTSYRMVSGTGLRLQLCKRPSEVTRYKLWASHWYSLSWGLACPVRRATEGGERGQKSGLAWRGFDHTLITPWASVGAIGQKRSACTCLESATYDWIGLVLVGRNGFQFPLALPIPPRWPSWSAWGPERYQPIIKPFKHYLVVGKK